MCPHPLASADCARLHLLLAVPGAMAALIFAVSLLLWRAERGRRGRRTLFLLGAVPSSVVASVAASWLFLRLDLFRSRHDASVVMVAMLALTLAIELLYVGLERWTR